MADTRINALSTATSSVSDDFVPIDGTTNGTRKLSAYSPTFGGNATVGGTLTVSGNTTLSGNLDVASGISTGTAQLQIGNGRTGSGYAYVDLVGDTTYSDYGFRIIRNNGGANTSSELAHRGTGDFALVANDAAPIKFYTNGVTAATIAATTGNTTIHSTTASTSTSSGALVVGNGSSGGLGVGGAINAGGIIQAGSGSNILYLSGDTGSNAYLTTGASSTVTNVYIGSASGCSAPTVVQVNGTTRFTVASTGATVSATTASTSTSSGALVVSGGVGVAKSLNVGEAVTVAGGAFAAASFYKSASLGTVLSGATGSSYDLYITNPAGNHVMQVPTGTRNAEFAATLTTVGAITSGASISTSAPTGGSGAWELGVYSTTAPSATGYVTIEIGGTVYKLLASNV